MREIRKLDAVYILAALIVSCSGGSRNSSSREGQASESDSTVTSESQNQTVQTTDGLSVPEVLAGSYLIQNVSRTKDPNMLRASVILVKDMGASAPTRILPVVAAQLDGITWFLAVDGKVQSFKGRPSASLAESADDMSWLLPLRPDRSIPIVKVSLKVSTRVGEKVAVDTAKTSRGSLEGVPLPPDVVSSDDHLFFTSMNTYPLLHHIQGSTDVPPNMNGLPCTKLLEALNGSTLYDSEALMQAKANAICNCEAAISAKAPVFDARDKFEAIIFTSGNSIDIINWGSQFRAKYRNRVRASSGSLLAEAGNILPDLSAGRTAWGQEPLHVLQSLAIDQNGMPISPTSLEDGQVQTGFPFFGLGQDLTKSSNCRGGAASQGGYDGDYFGLGHIASPDERVFWDHSVDCNRHTKARLFCISK